ncbi:MAG: hypothetical protein J7556_15105 [Acidovorax sp.]|nr:hypothetical protein [Acidovorax sp.]
MSFPRINGAAINGTEGGDIAIHPPGLDLVTAGQHVGFGYAVAGGGVPMEFGDLRVVTAIKPSGMDLVTNGVHVGEHPVVVEVPGLDMVSHGLSFAVFTPVAGDVHPLEFGATRLRIGTDAAVKVQGMDLVRPGLHSAMGSPILPSGWATTAGAARPLELGNPAVVPAPEARTAGGAQPMEFGMPATGYAALAGGVHPTELGSHAVGYAARAGGAITLQVGVPVIGMSISPVGFDMVRAGIHAAVGGASFSVAGGATPAETGTPGPLGYMSTARPAFPMQLGSPSIGRGATC